MTYEELDMLRCHLKARLYAIAYGAPHKSCLSRQEIVQELQRQLYEVRKEMFHLYYAASVN